MEDIVKADDYTFHKWKGRMALLDKYIQVIRDNPNYSVEKIKKTVKTIFESPNVCVAKSLGGGFFSYTEAESSIHLDHVSVFNPEFKDYFIESMICFFVEKHGLFSQKDLKWEDLNSEVLQNLILGSITKVSNAFEILKTKSIPISHRTLMEHIYNQSFEIQFNDN